MSPEDVHCFIVNEDTYVETEVEFTLTNDNTVTLAAAVPAGSKLRVRRITPKDTPLVDYAGGSMVSEDNLDKANRQAVLSAAEAMDEARLSDWRFENEVQGPKGDKGDPGPPGSSGTTAYTSRALMAAAGNTATDLTFAYLAEEGRTGDFVFDTANLSTQVAADPSQGMYIARAGDATGATGAWVRQFDGPVNVRWFGAKGDGVTNDGAAFLAALATLKALSVNKLASWYQSSAGLFIPAGHYFMGVNTLDLTHTVVIEGEGSGISSGATKLRWSAGATGIRVQRYNTSGATGVVAGGFNAGDGSVIRGLWLVGGFTTTEGEFHGIHLRAMASIEHCKIENFQGDGVYSDAVVGSGGVQEGAANCARLGHTRVWDCRKGLYLDGADTNVWHVEACDFSGNRTWGVDDSSFLGNTYVTCHTAGNGWDGGSLIPTACTYMGNRYYVKVGQAAWCKSNPPTGTTADNTGWGYIAAGGVYTGVPEWVDETYDFREGGAYKTDNANGFNVFLGCYSEGDQSPSQIVQPTVVFGGLHGAGVFGTGAHIIGSMNGALRNANGYVAIGQTGYGNSLLQDRLEFTRATDTYTLEWLSNDLVYTVLRSGVPSNWAFRLTGEATSHPVGKRRMVFDNGFGLGLVKVMPGNAAPTSGAYNVGDTVINTEPAAGEPILWRCVTAGSPGTWEAVTAGGSSGTTISNQNVASAPTVTPTFADDQVNITAQGEALNLANPTGTAVNGWGIVIRIKDSGSTRAITYGTQYRAATGVTLPTATVVGKTHYISMVYNAADTKWDVLSVAEV